MRSSGLNDFAATPEERIAELDNAQIGPGSRAPANHRQQRLLGWPVPPRLSQDQRRRRSRARYAGVAVNQKMGILHFGQVTSEGEEELDILPLRCRPPRTGFDNVVEAQLEPLVRVEIGKGLELGPAGIQNRQHVRDASVAVQADLIDAAKRHFNRHEPPREQSYPPRPSLIREPIIASSCGNSMCGPSAAPENAWRARSPALRFGRSLSGIRPEGIAASPLLAAGARRLAVRRSRNLREGEPRRIPRRSPQSLRHRPASTASAVWA